MPPSWSRKIVFALTLLAIFVFCSRAQAQAALLMEEPYGFFGTLNPTGHTAIYFSRICAETPVKLRRCEPGELGSVIAKYQGIGGYDWVAMPLIPYLYSVNDASEVPGHVNRETVLNLRWQYHEQHLGVLGAHVFEGNIVHGGWNQLIGVSYERRIYAFRFATTEAQDEEMMDRLNDTKNRSDFNLLYNNCADFARSLMNSYFPHTFKRTIFPDAGMTTPRAMAFKLERYAKKHPGTELTVFEIPQVPGYRRHSHPNKSVAASLITTGYAVPIALINPYLAGGIFIDYLVRGRYSNIPRHPEILGPADLSALASGVEVVQAPPAASQTGTAQPSPAQSGPAVSAARSALFGAPANPGLKEIVDPHE
ncbi:MAG TPA: hypothetical protein VKB38_24310 [Terracidiphilus sp.]|nr:hypothetical protein [Terracidiphilus sp.]